MEEVSDVYFTPLTESAYLQPFRFNYTQNGLQRTWDLLEVHDSVAILIFNVTHRKLVFVKQFRPAVYFNCVAPDDREEEFMDMARYPASLGITIETCAGIVDKPQTLEEIAVDEVLEECGYKITTGDLEKISCYRAGVGVQGATQTLYYCEVTDDMKVSRGGGVEDELIEVVEMSIPAVEALVLEQRSGVLATPPSCLFAFMWFLHYKADKHRKSFERYCGECKDVDPDASSIIPIVRDK